MKKSKIQNTLAAYLRMNNFIQIINNKFWLEFEIKKPNHIIISISKHSSKNYVKKYEVRTYRPPSNKIYNISTIDKNIINTVINTIDTINHEKTN